MSETSEKDRLTLDVPEAGKLLGLGRNASYEAAAKGEIPTIRIGKRILVPKAAFERFLAAPEFSNDHSFKS
jgi:excisionase family DNA binding protein